MRHIYVAFHFCLLHKAAGDSADLTNDFIIFFMSVSVPHTKLGEFDVSVDGNSYL